MERIKQVIVVRKDLKMRAGKMAAQVAHASSMFMAEALDARLRNPDSNALSYLSDEDVKWLQDGLSTKIVVGVPDLASLMLVIEKARDADLYVYEQWDEGLTEFHGQRTLTCIAIGPHKARYIDPITGDLELL